MHALPASPEELAYLHPSKQQFNYQLYQRTLDSTKAMKMVSDTHASHRYPLVKLPHPYLTTYRVCTIGDVTPAQLTLSLDDQPGNGRLLTEPLHSTSLTWLDLTSRPKDDCPPLSDNSAWARAYRSPQSTFQWSGNTPPTLGQVWNAVHAIYLAYPTNEYFRLRLHGAQENTVCTELVNTGLGIQHPQPWYPTDGPVVDTEELLILRSSFWQGAASPLGSRPIWVVGDGTDGPLRKPLDQYPIMPENHHFTMRFPKESVYTRHPIRRPKPYPGSICYSRYVPELDEHFSLEVVDWQSEEHLKIFNKWQNDPRVAQGWNETGTLNEHREYLRKLHFDPHVLCLFGRFNNSRFAYFELYWSKVSVSHNSLCC
jgi:hypothetical protein